MDKRLYLPSGFLNFRAIRDMGYPFTFVVGGRGTGKTYGALACVEQDKNKFMFMRRTQTQADLINKPEFSPYKKYCADTGLHIGTKTISKYNSAFYYMEGNNQDGWECTGAPIGYTCALSTISNMRGFDASDVEILLYDEFIPEKHERPLKNEYAALMNAYESINRNRELGGEKALQLICMANANDLANPVFLSLGLVRQAEKMRAKRQEIWTDDARGICLIILQASPISAAKQQTALYRLAGDDEFSRMSLGNEFSGDQPSRIRSRPLREYRPLVRVGEITIYEHKAGERIYVSTHHTGGAPTYGAGDTELARFARAYAYLWRLYMSDGIEFEEYLCEVLFRKYFGA